MAGLTRIHKYVPDKETEKLVHCLALAGNTDETIANAVALVTGTSFCERTLKNHYAKTLHEARVVKKGRIAGEAYHIAMLPLERELVGGEVEPLAPELVKAKVTMLCFLAKTQLEWRETQRLEVEGNLNITPVVNLNVSGAKTGSDQLGFTSQASGSLPDKSH